MGHETKRNNYKRSAGIFRSDGCDSTNVPGFFKREAIGDLHTGLNLLFVVVLLDAT